MKKIFDLLIIKPRDISKLIYESRNTSISRERYIDLLKVLSILIITFSTEYFLSLSTSGYEVIIKNNSVGNLQMSRASWFLNGLAIFFFCNGFSNSIAWYSNIGRDGSVWEFLANRINSILGPVLYLIVFGSIFIHFSISNGYFPEYFVTELDGLHPVSEFLLWPLWLVSIYLVVVMCSPVTAFLHKKNSLVSVFTILTLFLSFDYITSADTYSYFRYINYLFFWLFIHQLGYFFADGTLQNIKKSYYFIVFVGSYLALYYLSLNEGSLLTVSNFRLTSFTNEDPPTLMMLLSSIGLISFILLFNNFFESLLNKKYLWYIVCFMNAHIYTYFLWHTFFFVSLYFFDIQIGYYILFVTFFLLIVGSPERNSFRLAPSLIKRVNPEQPWPLPIKARFSFNKLILSWYGAFLILLGTIQITLGGVGIFGFLVDRQLFFLHGNTFEAISRLIIGMILLNITIRSNIYRNGSLFVSSTFLLLVILSRPLFGLPLYRLELSFTLFGLFLCIYSLIVHRNKHNKERV